MKAQLDHIGVVVNDMAKALAFYRQLGLEIPPEADRQPHVEVTLRGGIRLAWDTEDVIRSFNPDWSPPSGGHRIGLSFLFDTPSDVNEAYATLTGQGYEGYKEPWDAFWGQRYALVLDPDGNIVDLFAPSNPA
jgi:catechol 2,3-dioxygenase-like lactoylglutathione lyase family enzyme